MKNQRDDIIQQKQSELTFTFQHQNDQLLIKAQSYDGLYCGFLQPNPLLPFEKIKKALTTKNYQLLSQSKKDIEITIAGILDLKMKSQDQLTLQLLKETILKLTAKLQNQAQKHTQLETIVKQIQNEISQMKSQSQHEQNKLNQKFSNIEFKLQTLDEQMSSNTTYLNESIATLKHEIIELREEILQQQESINQNSSKTSQNQKSILNTTHQLDSLNAPFNQLKTQFNRLLIQTIPKCITYEPDFMMNSKIVYSEGEKSVLRKFFTKKIKETKLLYRASDNDFGVKKFHQKCDGIADTVTVVWTEFGRKVGGYTPLKWSSPQAGGFVADNSMESFIFSLSQNDKLIMQEPGSAIYNGQNYGPIFGGGDDLSVRDHANSNDSSYANICHNYHNKKYKLGDKASWERFHGGATGSNQFKIRDWEVWKVEWAV